MNPHDMEAVVDLLAKWNMAPVEATSEVPDPERDSVNVEHSFVALDADRLVGICSYIIISRTMAETASLAVDPAYKGKHIGERLQVARLKEMKGKGIKRVITETDRPETIKWYIRKFGYRIVGKNKKKHAFSLPHIDHWTALELDLESYEL